MTAVAALTIAMLVIATWIPKLNRNKHANHIAALRQQVQHWEMIRSGAWHPLTEEEVRVHRMSDAAFHLHIGNYYDAQGEHEAADTSRQYACYLAGSNSVSDLEQQCRKSSGMWDVRDSDTVTHYFNEAEAAAAAQRIAIKTAHCVEGETVEFSTRKVLTNQ